MYRIFKSIPIYGEAFPKPEDFNLTDEIITNVIKSNETRRRKIFNSCLIICLCGFIALIYLKEPFLAFFMFFLFPMIQGICECYIYPEQKDETIALVNKYYKAKEEWWKKEAWRNSIKKMQYAEFWTNKKNNININKFANLFFAAGYTVKEENGHLLLQKDGKNIIVFKSSSLLNYSLEHDDYFKNKCLENNNEIWLISLEKRNKSFKNLNKEKRIELITIPNLVNFAKTYCKES